MFWNETKAPKGSEICGILYELIQIKTDSRFFERWTATCNQKGLKFRGIINDAFQASQKAWYGNNVAERLQHWDARLISEVDFSITHVTIVYDNVVAYFNWKDNEVFGIEIYNQQIADSQRHFFELLWDKAAPA